MLPKLCLLPKTQYTVLMYIEDEYSKNKKDETLLHI